ncbi:hypothetical protein APHAL10511_002364 [Amanita phalloides]|nr:hypothetical protein APHAL10511_002364 [Amanita phalloides]
MSQFCHASPDNKMNGLALLAAQAQAASAKNPTPVHSDDLQPRRSAVLSQTARRGSSHKPGQHPYGHGISVHVQVHGQHEAGMPWDAQRTSSQQGDERLNDVQRPRPRPIPLPPPSSSRFAASFRVGAGDAGTTGGDSMAPLSALATTETVDRSRSPKRRKVDHALDHLSLASSNMTRAGVITNKSPPSTRPPPRASPESPVKVKNEPESPSFPSVQRKAFLFPDDDGKKMDPTKEVERGVKAKGFPVGKYVVRGDDISIEWPSPALVAPASLEGSSRSRTETDSSIPLTESQSKKGIPFNGPTAISTPPVSQSAEMPSPQKPPILSSHHKPTPPLSYHHHHPMIPPSPAPPPPTSASPKPPPPPPPVIASPQPTTPPSRRNASARKRKRKPKTEHVPYGGLDLATAIRLSQRDNASPRPPPFRRQTSSSGRSSSSSTRSPATAGSSMAKLAAYDTPTRAPRVVPSSGLARETRFAEDEDEVEVVEVGSGGGGGGEEEEEGGEVEGEGKEAVVGVGQASGWTVIQDITDPEEGVEDERDQLVEDEEDELKEEMEAAKAVNMGTKDESGDERDEVENVAILNGVPSPTMTERVLPEAALATTSETMADPDLHGLSRDFLSKYMLVYETDRARLISAYAPDAKLIYRVSEPPPAEAKTSRFPLRSARGHDEISTFLHGLGWTHVAQKLDEDGNKEVDVEFQSERLDQGVWLYVRSVVTTEDVQQQPSGSDSAHRWSVDHSFLLRHGTSESAMDDAWPLIAHVHQLVMHESRL